ncbi:polysaccharide deacetylase family protein [Ferruginibacter albus]|uniref:polysaccharide deacetylase family protein n=1 Tax=Ferruginibacter albus TaxID=2875540 RepID=UPI001CC34C86|nr:polysaccharide deacetylase family protein [Ferruginibacter albus]UAY52228.1 polysaccharide deacetylase family protein [Ferruginibacter albus]
MVFLSKQNIAVLLFHRILPLRDEMWDPIDPALFKQTLDYAKKKFHVVPLSEILFNQKPRSSKPLAALTFDDGYHDFIDHAIPILDAHKMKASMYVVSDCIDKNLPTWTYVIDYLFVNTKKLQWDNFNHPDLPGEYHLVKWNTQQERINYCKKLKQYIKWIPASKRDEIINDLLINFDDVKSPHGLMMSWAEVKQINNAGFEIGSHSVTHATLATIEDDNVVEFELKESAKRITAQTGIVPSVFSYPIGSYDERVKKLTKKAGYKAALAVNKKMYAPERDDIFEIPRIELYNESWLKTKMRVNGTVSYLNKFRNR